MTEKAANILEAPPGSPLDVPTVDVPSWKLTKIASTGTLVIRFVGPTRTHEIPEFLAALSEAMGGDRVSVVFDLRELHGHNPNTKEPTKRWLMAHKHRLDEITVVVPKSATILKLVTAVMSLATGVKIKVRDDLAGEAVMPGIQVT